MASIKEILKVLTRADKARDRHKATAPGEKVDMVTQGLESLLQLVQGQPSLSSDSSNTESAYASKDGGQSRGRSKGCRMMDKKTTHKLLPSPSTSCSPTPPPSKGQSRSKCRSKSSKRKKDEKRERNPTGCKYCAKHGGNGYAHATPKNIPHKDATSTPSTKDGGRSGYATSWKLSTRSGTNPSIDGVGIGLKRRWNSRAGFLLIKAVN